ncbi:variably expressed lipoprotein and hemagglutinin (VlhA) family protein [Mycoplasmoides gallisepticum CA06_2006.052-5-2P]|uniref:Variably expressed lipoprotein and hemagglutinin (VlhA) family protein n=1 Tax=Mycoplasmoides gallisepticum WI01_2001.043-13-2P TaxID=1159201 RepID=J3T9K8_MYCGL|nr:FIVAR domain-containing protein [Mycoplasmoides gallisepticum]AFP76341.1 variably expressed lipoprotein and hemagglutinin (VlhA) family protein [Mycoplasmoides gallisepticum VA94_7994-1-7P]AFP77109.1 variably expressed lipoprotein and hemagglutinin (VlhA) family protein [Mycoplasmoides gallisepticum NC95_13295-2-2P]AFP77885.1 variably expressed lipoprotein and hemagglutinin (VlhA) family protein [Mycoplasmoides gallisepticum NC96_1596-4-2P]AFP78634.1 variably expressed lipoprotein and hemagg
MKRKNILKFVSLLGIGSFVMLAAASCTSATTPTPNPEPKPDPMPNPPSGGMNGGNTNPGNGGGMMGDNPNPGNTTPKQQLAAARKTLTDLLGTENTNVALYADYAKIQSTLSTAYMTAKTASENTSATLDNLRSASTTLQAAIDKAASDKRAFDSANQSLVAAYNNLKTTLQSKTNSLEGLSENKYSGIKNHLSKLFDAGSAITARTLDPTSGERPTLEKVNEANNGIKMAISSESLNKWKTNADKFNDFEKNPLSKEKLESTNDTAHNQEQPANWSFAAYSVDLTSNSQNLPNWNFAQRKVWTSEGQEGGRTVLVSSPVSSTDVSWIYSLAGEGTKYTLSFEYYGPDTAFLYFPYKLVKQADSNSVALQYSLNKASPKLINFQPVRTEPANADSTTNETTTTGSSESRSSSEVLVADEAATSNNEMNPTPTVDSINIAKVTLTGLAFGQNTIEFSVPTDQTNKVAPMIGNMFISSNSESQEKIYNQIFGNTSNLSTDSRSVTVDLLKGYSLASGWSTYVGEFKRLTGANQTASDSQTSAPSYLVGFIAGSGQRTVNNVSNRIRNPNIAGQKRTLAIYVNAPSDGQYGISGSYISTNRTQRSLKFQTGSDDSNSVTINVTAKTAWTALETFDTSDTTNNVVSGNMAKRTLHLKQGLNKIVISGTNDTPYIGNLTFTLNNNPLSNTESETREST